MTDPIEQARAGYAAAAVNLDYADNRVDTVEAEEARAAFSALKQAIRLHDPDVVRLVLAARATVALNRKKGSPLGDYGPTADLDAALDHFKEVQE